MHMESKTAEPMNGHSNGNGKSTSDPRSADNLAAAGYKRAWSAEKEKVIRGWSMEDLDDS